MSTTKLQQIQAFNQRHTQTKDILGEKLTQKEKEELDAKDRIAIKASETRAKLAADAKAEAERLQAQEQQASIVQKGAILADKGIAAAATATAPTRSWIENLPTPGGIATILSILVFFMFVAVPVNAQGDTRLKLLWLTLTGKTALKDENALLGASGSGDFGSHGGPQRVPVELPTSDSVVSPFSPPLVEGLDILGLFGAND